MMRSQLRHFHYIDGRHGMQDCVSTPLHFTMGRRSFKRTLEHLFEYIHRRFLRDTPFHCKSNSFFPFHKKGYKK